MCVCAHSCLTLCTGVVEDGFVCTCSVVSDFLHQSSAGWLFVCVRTRARSCPTLCTGALADGGVCVCVYMLSHVRLFAPEQWQMALCVCVCSVISDSLHWSSAYGCMCVSVCSVVSDSLC